MARPRTPRPVTSSVLKRSPRSTKVKLEQRRYRVDIPQQSSNGPNTSPRYIPPRSSSSFIVALSASRRSHEGRRERADSSVDAVTERVSDVLISSSRPLSPNSLSDSDSGYTTPDGLFKKPFRKVPQEVSHSSEIQGGPKLEEVEDTPRAQAVRAAEERQWNENRKIISDLKSHLIEHAETQDLRTLAGLLRIRLDDAVNITEFYRQWLPEQLKVPANLRALAFARFQSDLESKYKDRPSKERKDIQLELIKASVRNFNLCKEAGFETKTAMAYVCEAFNADQRIEDINDCDLHRPQPQFQGEMYRIGLRGGHRSSIISSGSEAQSDKIMGESNHGPRPEESTRKASGPVWWSKSLPTTQTQNPKSEFSQSKDRKNYSESEPQTSPTRHGKQRRRSVFFSEPDGEHGNEKAELKPVENQSKVAPKKRKLSHQQESDMESQRGAVSPIKKRKSTRGVAAVVPGRRESRRGVRKADRNCFDFLGPQYPESD